MDIENVIAGLDQLFETNQGEKVEDYLSGYLEQALKEGDAGSAITLINELIGFYRDTSQYGKATAYCEKLPSFMERAGLSGTVHYGTSCLNIANAYRAAGRLEDSMKYYHIVFDIYEQVLEPGDFRYASLHNNLSLLYQEMGEFDKACGELEQALSIVLHYPGAIIEQGVTYTNLAASYNRAGQKEKAKEMVEKGLAIFEDGHQDDFHYSAALSVAGDVWFAYGEYEKAADRYEQAMLVLRRHVGVTHAYFRIVSNLQTCYEALGKPEALKGLVLCRTYYEQFGKKVFEKLQEELKGEEAGNDATFTIAKAGEGSDCFGLDDILSKDHDFGPGFALFVTRQQYEQYGERLQEAYDGLPSVFRGFDRPVERTDMPRNGVIIIEDFFGRILNLEEEEVAYLLENAALTENAWLKVKDWQLKTVTNGEIFAGENGVFGRIYTALKKGYPQKLWRRKVAQCLGEICQDGQYNYKRLMQRGDSPGAAVLLHSFEEHVLEFLYLINREYAPHKKWMLKGAELLSEGQDILGKLKELLCKSPDPAAYQQRDCIEWVGTVNRGDQVLSAIEEIAALISALLLEKGLTKSRETYLEAHIPYLLVETLD